MLINSKFFFTLVGLIVAVFAICNTNMSPVTSEGFWMNGSRAVTVEKVAHNKKTNQMTSLGRKSHEMRGHNKFVSYPSYQGMLSPRFGNYDVGANIRYNPPSYKNQAVPCNPLDFGDMAQENYKGPRENYSGACGSGCGGSNCGVAKCGKGGVSLGRNTSRNGESIGDDPNYTSAMNKVYDEYGESSGSAMVSQGDMTTIDSEGKTDQVVVYDRYIYANPTPFGYGQGDPIRGDLKISSPAISENYFRPHQAKTPSLYLNPGAINVIAGNRNETNNQLSEFLYEETGGYSDTPGGDLSMANQLQTSLGSGMSDIRVSSFS
jgi:hypothetical protein